MEKPKESGVIEEIMGLSSVESDKTHENFLARLVGTVHETIRQETSEKERKNREEAGSRQTRAGEGREATSRPEEQPRARYNLD